MVERLTEVLFRKTRMEILQVLFGSVARGTPDLESDIDVLVVLKEQDDSAENRIKGLAKEINEDTGFNISPLILEESEVIERMEKSDSFIKSVEEEGKALYGGKGGQR